MNTLSPSLSKAALVAGLILGGQALHSAHPQKRSVSSAPSKNTLSATEEGATIPISVIQKSPYQTEQVYKVRLVPGSPVMVEIPMGETPENIWFDSLWWNAESTPGSNRMILKALNVDGIRGRKSNIHVETSPSNLRISFQVEAVGEDQDPPSVVVLYLNGSDLEAKARIQAHAKAIHDVAQFKKQLAVDAQGQFEAWKATAITKMSDGYKFEKGKLGLEKVVSDGTQTYITARSTEQAALKLKNRDGVEETLNYELKDGVFVVNHLLLPGENFMLVVGKETATIRLK